MSVTATQKIPAPVTAAAMRDKLPDIVQTSKIGEFSQTAKRTPTNWNGVWKIICDQEFSPYYEGLDILLNVEHLKHLGITERSSIDAAGGDIVPAPKKAKTAEEQKKEERTNGQRVRAVATRFVPGRLKRGQTAPVAAVAEQPKMAGEPGIIEADGPAITALAEGRMVILHMRRGNRGGKIYPPPFPNEKYLLFSEAERRD